MKRKNKKLMRRAAMLLCMILCLSIIPMSAFAAPGDFMIYRLEDVDAGIGDNAGYYFVQEDDGTFPVYCHDEGYHEPTLDPANFGRSNYLDVATTGDNAFTYAYGNSTDGYQTLTLTDNIRNKVLSAMYAGYPNDGAGLCAKYPTTAAHYQIATQNVIWELLHHSPFHDLSSYNDANMIAYSDALKDYAFDPGPHGTGTLNALSSSETLTLTGGVYRTPAITVGGTFDGAVTLTLPANVTVKDSATNAVLTDPLESGDSFYLEYTGANADEYSGSVGYSYKTFDAAYIYSTDDDAPNNRVQRMIRLAVETHMGTIALAGENAPEAQTGNLSISKEVTGTGAPAAATNYTFTVTDANDLPAVGRYSVNAAMPTDIPANGQIVLQAGQTAILTGLAVGNYNVSEATPNVANYKSTSYQVNAGTATDGFSATVAVTANTTAAATVVFTNTYELNAPATSNLVVRKTVAGNDASTTKEFEFTVTLGDDTINDTYGDMNFTDGVAEFTLTNGSSAVATGLPADTTYVVSERDYTADGYVTTATGDTGTMVEGVPSVAAFVNTRNTSGDLTVSKTVSGTGADENQSFSFHIVLDNDEINGEYGDMTFTNGEVTLELKHGESATAENLPTGTGYTVTEGNNAGYIVTVNNTAETFGEGTISAEEASIEAFNNARDAEAPKPKEGGNPKTGDRIGVAMWALLIIVMMFGFMYIKRSESF